MDSPGEIARKYGGIDGPIYESDIENAQDAAIKKEREKKEKAEKRRKFMEEVQDDFRKETRKHKKNSSSTPANIVKGIIGLLLFMVFMDMAPSLIGGLIGLFVAGLSAIIILPVFGWVFFIVIQVFKIIFKIIAGIMKGIFSF